jgi:AraC-like DNA-binding protein
MLTEESLSQIALSCGFADQSHFSRLFRREVKASPANWRRQRRVVPAMQRQ